MIGSMISPMVRSMIGDGDGGGGGATTRYFIELDPVLNSHYHLATPITFAGDFEVEIEFKLDSLTGNVALIGGDTNSDDDFLRIDATNGGFDWRFGGVFRPNDGAFIPDNKLHTVVYKRVFNTITIRLDAAPIITVTGTPNLGDFTVNRIGSRVFATPDYFDGILANPKFTDLSTSEATTFKLDLPAGDIESSVEGNNSLTYVNATEREEYFLTDIGWAAQEQKVINGTFDANLSNWTATVNGGDTVEWDNGRLHIITDGSSSGVLQNSVTTTGIRYLHSFDYEAVSGGLKSGLASALTVVATTTQEYKIPFTADGSTIILYRWSGPAEGYFDNVSVRKLLEFPWTGNQIAHRGFLDDAPENTMSAYTATVGLGVLHLECDVQTTSDGEFVLLHDTTIDRTSDGTGAIASLTFAAADAFDYGAWFNVAFTGEQIPKFSEFCAFADANGCTIYPEIKSTMSNAEISDMIDIIVANNLELRCVIQSFDPADLTAVRGINSNITLGYLSSTLIDTSTVLSNSYVLISQTVLRANESYIKATQSKGIKVGAWTVAVQGDYDLLVALGVDAIMTNAKFEQS